MAEDAGVASEAWYETNTVAAIDAFYRDGDVKANLEYARRLLQSDASLQEITEQLDDDRRDAEFRHPVQGRVPKSACPFSLVNAASHSSRRSCASGIVASSPRGPTLRSRFPPFATMSTKDHSSSE